MQIITAHRNTDFDGLASMVACTCLYPGAVGVLPSAVTPGVKAFLAIHEDLFRIRPRKGFDLGPVESLIVVDTNSWQMLDQMSALEKKAGLEIIAWDHHMKGATIVSGETHREETGAAVTLLVEEMKRRDTPMTPMQATLFLLGIYDDTGSLRFSSVTPKDAMMTAFLLENGANLDVVSAYLSDTIDDSHAKVFADMLAKSRMLEVKGLNAGISAMPVHSNLTMLSSLVEKFKDFKGLDAAVGIFFTSDDKALVIGRGDPKAFDMGAVFRTLGGGGHPAAGSAVVKGEAPKALEDKVAELILDTARQDIKVGDIMSEPHRFTIAPSLTLAQAAAILDGAGLRGLLVARDNTLLGMLPQTVIDKARKKNRLDSPAKGALKSQIPVVSPWDNARTAMEAMNRSPEGLLPVVDQGRLTGVLTRGNLVLHLYDI